MRPDDNYLHVEIPAFKHEDAWIIGVIWTMFAAPFTVFASLKFAGNPPRDWGFWVFWVCWCGGVVMSMASLWWQACGREEVELDPNRLRIAQVLGPFSWRRCFDVRNISYLGVPPVDDGFRGHNGFGFRPGRIAFDYQGETVRFGSWYDEARARELIAQMLTIAPSMGRQRLSSE